MKIDSSKPFQIGRVILMVFFAAATVIAALASFTMLVTGTVVDDIWKAKEVEYHQMLHHRIPIGFGFALLAVLLALAVVGVTRRRKWSWGLSVLIFGVNLIADLASLIASKSWSDLMPVVIEILVLMWLLLPRTKRELIG